MELNVSIDCMLSNDNYPACDNLREYQSETSFLMPKNEIGGRVYRCVDLCKPQRKFLKSNSNG